MLLQEFLSESLSADAQLYRRFNFAALDGDNRRFIYDPASRRMIIGGYLTPGNNLEGSHAEDWYDVTGSNRNFDRCVRGWVGMGGSYRHGIIHFAPPIDAHDDGAYACIRAFVRAGATGKCKLRGAPSMSELNMAEVYPDLFKVAS